MKHLISLTSLLLFAASVYLCVEVISHARGNQKNKNDYAELNSVTYGLFSIDAWKEKLTVIFRAEIDSLSVSDETQAELRRHVSSVLNKMIDEAAVKIEKSNNKTTGGKIKQMFMNMFIDVKPDLTTPKK